MRTRCATRFPALRLSGGCEHSLHAGGEFEDAAIAPPDAASISPTGASPSRWQGSEMAQPSIMLISVQLRSDSRFSLVNALSSARSAIRGGVFAVVGITNAS